MKQKRLQRTVVLLLLSTCFSTTTLAQDVVVDSLKMAGDSLAVPPAKKGNWFKRTANKTADFSKKQFNKVEKALKLDDESVEAGWSEEKGSISSQPSSHP